VDLAGFEPAASSVRWMIEGLSASSSTLFWCFLPLYTRENGVKTINMSVFYHAMYFALHTVAHGMKKEMQSITLSMKVREN
jgi:hypothetical protein